MRTIRQRIFLFIEHPLFALPVGTVSGLVGVYYYSPLLVICVGCILLALHRSGAISDWPMVPDQFGTYVFIGGVVVVLLVMLQVRIQSSQTSQQIPTAEEIARAIENNRSVSSTPNQNPQVTAKTEYVEPEAPKKQALTGATSKTSNADEDVRIIQHQLVVREAFEKQLIDDYPLGWDLFTIDGFRATETKKWLPDFDPRNQRSTDFAWQNGGAGNVSAGPSKDQIRIGLPTIVGPFNFAIANLATLYWRAGSTCTIELSPEEPQTNVFMMGNDLCGFSVKSFFGITPTMIEEVKVLAATDSELAGVVGLKPYRK